MQVIISVFNIRMGAYFILLVIFPQNTIYSNDVNSVNYRFTHTDSSYTFYGSFKIRAKPACLMEIVFEFDHIRALAPDAKEILLISQDSAWNIVSYTFRKYIFFENTSVWFRTIDREDQRVDFTLVKSINNQTLMPQIISSDGSYKIKQEGEYITVDYFQQCQVEESSMTKIYLNRLENEAIEFIYFFSDYAKEYCKTSSFPNK